MRTSERTPLLTMLLEGPPKTGKTAIAAHLAVNSQFPFARIISPDQLVGLSEFSKCARIKEVFSDAYRSPLSCIVLDDLERLIEYVNVGPRFANTVRHTYLLRAAFVPPPFPGLPCFPSFPPTHLPTLLPSPLTRNPQVLQTLLVLLKKRPSKPGNRLLVVATTSMSQNLADLGLDDSCLNVSINVPPLTEPSAVRSQRLHILAPLDASLVSYPHRLVCASLFSAWALRCKRCWLRLETCHRQTRRRSLRR